MLAIGIVTITKAFELVLIIHESHSYGSVFRSRILPCDTIEDSVFFSFSFLVSLKN